MAGHGPAPKDRKKRRRRNADPVPENTVKADGRTRGPQLPRDILPAGEDWHPRTKAWWATWRRSAQAKMFTATDWDFLLDTALMHHTMWTKSKWEFAAELRLRAAKFGATPEDRLRLRMEVETPGSQKPAASSAAGSVTDIASRRVRLTG
ncbi:MAG: hypothetical protein ACRDMV_25295 [Streptosporangiales bacterium]